jgi:hypothetical protein
MNSPPTNAGTLGGDATLGRPARSGVRLRAATLALGLVAAALGALAIGVVAVRQPASPLPVLGTVPVFELTEASGRPISRAELAGKLWIADFVFTSCAASCPKMTAEMARIQRASATSPTCDWSPSASIPRPIPRRCYAAMLRVTRRIPRAGCS